MAGFRTASLERGALVSWRRAGSGSHREAGYVVDATATVLVVDIVDAAGSYRFAGAPEDFPGLTVDLRAAQTNYSPEEG